MYKVLYSKLESFTDLVFYVENEEEAKTLISLADKHNVCLIPFGGGTSVSNALKIPKDENRMVVSVDTRRMNKIESVDEKNLLATVQSGILGIDLENKLQEMGYTADHLIRYIKKINYAFYDEDFKPVLDIKLVSSKLTDKSQNYFLFHNSFLVI